MDLVDEKSGKGNFRRNSLGGALSLAAGLIAFNLTPHELAQEPAQAAADQHPAEQSALWHSLSSPRLLDDKADLLNIRRLKIISNYLVGGASNAVIALNSWSASIASDRDGYLIEATDQVSNISYRMRISNDGAVPDGQSMRSEDVDQVLQNLEQARIASQRYHSRIEPLDKILNGQNEAELCIGDTRCRVSKGHLVYVLELEIAGYKGGYWQEFLTLSGSSLSSVDELRVDQAQGEMEGGVSQVDRLISIIRALFKSEDERRRRELV